jgi:hypothetical protein
MKKTILGISLLIAVLLSCKNDNNDDPKTVLSHFFNALAKQDTATARRLTTADGQFMLDYLNKVIASDRGIEFTGKLDKDKIEYGEARIENDIATVPVKETITGSTMNYTLRKENGSWKVNFDVSSIISQGFEQMQKEGLGPTDSVRKAFDELRELYQDSLPGGKKLIDSINKELKKIEKK